MHLPLGALKNKPNYPAYPELLMHSTVSLYRLSDHNNTYCIVVTVQGVLICFDDKVQTIVHILALTEFYYL